jgi:hypothetical protein
VTIALVDPNWPWQLVVQANIRITSFKPNQECQGQDGQGGQRFSDLPPDFPPFPAKSARIWWSIGTDVNVFGLDLQTGGRPGGPYDLAVSLDNWTERQV